MQFLCFLNFLKLPPKMRHNKLNLIETAQFKMSV